MPKKAIQEANKLAQCRLCQETDYVDALMVPCKCSPSEGSCHFDCLKRSIEMECDGYERCKLCDSPVVGIGISHEIRSGTLWAFCKSDTESQVTLILALVVSMHFAAFSGSIHQFLCSSLMAKGSGGGFALVIYGLVSTLMTISMVLFNGFLAFKVMVRLVRCCDSNRMVVVHRARF